MRKVVDVNGVPSILFIYHHSGLGIKAYLVPLDLAIKLELEKYQGKYLYEFEDFLEELKPYEFNGYDYLYAYNHA